MVQTNTWYSPVYGCHGFNQKAVFYYQKEFDFNRLNKFVDENITSWLKQKRPKPVQTKLNSVSYVLINFIEII